MDGKPGGLELRCQGPQTAGGYEVKGSSQLSGST